MSQGKECLEWLESLDSAYIGEEEREELRNRFPDVEINTTGCTGVFEDGELKLPKRDYIDALRYGQPLD